jgi:hypothetical protein
MINLYFPVMTLLSMISIINILMMVETYEIRSIIDETRTPLHEKYKTNFFFTILFMLIYTLFYCYINYYYDPKVSAILALMLSLFLIIIFIKVTQ